MEVGVVHIFRNSLIGVKPFVDAGCINIFHPHQCGVTIHLQEDVHIEFLAPPIIKVVREESGLLRVPLNNNTKPNGKSFYSKRQTTTNLPADAQAHLSKYTINPIQYKKV